MSHHDDPWSTHDGSAKPALIIPQEHYFEARFRGGDTAEFHRDSLSSLEWKHKGNEDDIVAYRVIPYVREEITSADDLFYLQDGRGLIGNTIYWWTIDSTCYTTDITKARKFTRHEAEQMHKERHTDVPWPVAYIDRHINPCVDMNDIDHSCDEVIGKGIPLLLAPSLKPKPVRLADIQMMREHINHLETSLQALDVMFTGGPIDGTSNSAKNIPDLFDRFRETRQGYIDVLNGLRAHAVGDVTIDDYKQVIADSKRLTKELDVLLNGDRAAAQGSLCDIVSQIKGIVGAGLNPLLARVPEMTRMARVKISGLESEGWRINGYAICKGDRHGMVTTGGRVLWWNEGMGEQKPAADGAVWMIGDSWPPYSLNGENDSGVATIVPAVVGISTKDHGNKIEIHVNDHDLAAAEAIRDRLIAALNEPASSSNQAGEDWVMSGTDALAALDFNTPQNDDHRAWIRQGFAYHKWLLEHRRIPSFSSFVNEFKYQFDDAEKAYPFVCTLIDEYRNTSRAVPENIADEPHAKFIGFDMSSTEEDKTILFFKRNDAGEIEVCCCGSSDRSWEICPQHGKGTDYENERQSILEDLAHPKVSLIDVPEPVKEAISLSSISHDGDTYVAITEWTKNVGSFPVEANEQSLIRLDFLSNENAPGEYFVYGAAKGLVWGREHHGVNEIASYRIYAKVKPMPECPTALHDLAEAKDMSNEVPISFDGSKFSVYGYYSKGNRHGWNGSTPDYGIAIRHKPSGLEGRCHSERSQHANRHRAYLKLMVKVREWENPVIHDKSKPRLVGKTMFIWKEKFGGYWSIVGGAE